MAICLGTHRIILADIFVPLRHLGHRDLVPCWAAAPRWLSRAPPQCARLTVLSHLHVWVRLMTTREHHIDLRLKRRGSTIGSPPQCGMEVRPLRGSYGLIGRQPERRHHSGTAIDLLEQSVDPFVCCVRVLQEGVRLGAVEALEKASMQVSLSRRRLCANGCYPRYR